MRPVRIVLASASPRRLSLLRSIGLEPEVRPPRVDETRSAGEPASRFVGRLAADKARAAAEGLAGPALVLAADTAVVIDGEPLGKPADADEARRILRRLSSREHEVLTGVCALVLPRGETAGLVESTRVRFRDIDDRLLDWYVGTGEPLDKAGAYGIQERGAVLVERIEGSWTNVVGLPVERLPDLLAGLGVDPFRSRC